MKIKNKIDVGLFFFMLVISPLFTENVKADNALIGGYDRDDLMSVKISDAFITKQSNNNIELSFNIENRDGIQPQIIYTVNLLDNNTQTVVDQKVYDDIITLGPGESINKIVKYNAPEYLSGSFRIIVEIKNQDPFRFGNFQIKDAINLNGNGEFLDIDYKKCYLAIEGDNNKYEISETVDILENESLKFHCAFKNLFKNSKKIIPIFTTHYFSNTGKIISQEKGQMINLDTGEYKELVFDIPKMSKPQIYDTVLFFVDDNGNKISAPLNIGYILNGDILNILNFSIEKNVYKDNENIKVFLLWSDVKRSFPIEKKWRNDIELSDEKNILVDIYDNDSTRCAPTFKRVIDIKNGGGEMMIFPATKDCFIKKVNIKLVDKAGNIFANNIYELRDIKIENNPLAGKDSLPAALNDDKKKSIIALSIIFGIAIVSLIIVVIFIKKTYRRVLVFLLIGISSMLLLINHARAMGFYGSAGCFFYCNPNPPGFSFQPIPCPASSSFFFGCGPFTGGSVILSSGSCGSSNGKQFLNKPDTNLCSDGSNPTVYGSGPWNWTCLGFGGGASANCSASVIGSCPIVNKTVNSNYSCPNGETLNGSTCSYAANSTSTWSCCLYNYTTVRDMGCAAPGSVLATSGSSFMDSDASCNESLKTNGYLRGMPHVFTDWTLPPNLGSNGAMWGRWLMLNTSKQIISYSCNSGDTLSGTTCSHPATAAYSCSNVCSSLYNNTQASFTSSDSSCTTPTGPITYSLNCNCGIDIAKTNSAGVDSSSCTLCTSNSISRLTVNPTTNTTITSNDGIIGCSNGNVTVGTGQCSYNYPIGQVVTLKGSGVGNFFFNNAANWTMGCDSIDANNNCIVTMNSDKIISASSQCMESSNCAASTCNTDQCVGSCGMVTGTKNCSSTVTNGQKWKEVQP